MRAKTAPYSLKTREKAAFTLIELLVVMTIIVVLAGLILTIIPYINRKQSTARAEGEIKAITSALENYKADNGGYPSDPLYGAGSYTKGSTDNLDARVANDPTTTAGAQFSYIGSNPNSSANLVLYRALSGDRDLSRKAPAVNTSDINLDLDGNSLSAPLAAPPTVYYQFPASMLLPSGGTGTVTGIADPFGYYYGYSTAYQGDIETGVNPPTHGYNSTYDLWSTGGQIGLTTDTPQQIALKRAKWIYNWQNSGANAGQ